jgi:hypothetical protein
MIFPYWLEALLTPCPPSVRELGYLRESLAIQRCYGRCCYAWLPHLKRSRDVILAALAQCPTRRKAVIFGSGMLYDVPLDELAAAFREVVLVDIVQPRGTRRRLRRWPNVRLVAADVTGTVDEVYRVARLPNAELPRSEPSLFVGDADVDLVASVNLLPQLPYLPVMHLVRAGVHATDAIAAFARQLVQVHLDYLRRLPGVAALIADVEEVRRTAGGGVLDRTSTVYGVALPEGERWTWHLMPRSAAGTEAIRERQVVGVVDVKGANDYPAIEDG